MWLVQYFSQYFDDVLFAANDKEARISAVEKMNVLVMTDENGIKISIEQMYQELKEIQAEKVKMNVSLKNPVKMNVNLSISEKCSERNRMATKIK